jgi:hypothetical protein
MQDNYNASPAQCKPACDPDASVAFLDEFFGSEPRLLVAITADRKITAKTFAPGDDAARAWIERRNTRGNVYFSINPTKRPMEAKPAKDDVRAATHLWVDLDPAKDRPLEEERAEMLNLLNGSRPKGIPPFTWIIDSGRGYWGYLKLNVPKPLDGDLGLNTAQVEARALGIEVAYGRFADSCSNVDRIARLPGTVNHKTGRLAVVVSYEPTQTYPLEHFPKWGGAEPHGSGAEPQADPELVAQALATIPNDDSVPWNVWNRVGMAVFRATGGAGFEVFDAWSKKYVKYDAADTKARWEAYGSSPPTRIGAGTIFYLAREAGWKPPKNRDRRKGSVIVRAADVKMRPKDWLWEGHLLRGAQELLTGIPGLGKSQVQCSLVACATAALKWPDGAPAIAPVNVIMITAEDVLDQEVVPRLVAAGADTARVYFLTYIKTDDQKRQFLLAEDLDQLEREVAKIGSVGLVTIDPITAYLGGKTDSHKATDVRSQLGPLKDFAERTNVALSTITHPPKNSSQRAIDHFIGSQAFIAAGRIGHVCVEEQEEEEDEDGGGGGPTGRVLFANAKNNPHLKMSTLAYRVEGIIVGQDPDTGKNIEAARVVWDDEPVAVTADEAVAAAAKKGGKKDAGALDEAMAFLQGALQKGPRLATEVTAHAEAMMISTRTLARARKAAGVVATKESFDGPWKWELPPDASPI